MFSKSKGSCLPAQEDEKFLNNVTLEGRNTNQGRKMTEEEEQHPDRLKLCVSTL